MNARCDQIDCILLNEGNCYDDCDHCKQYINCDLARTIILQINVWLTDLELASPYGIMIYSEGENV